ncbi:MAG: hypothetical protein Ta2B_28410 [Termitinemataceae bacterium]|nr:MAG: hypothetical protein Ta2B_28410 [Termitinemataceae bacterium]
MDLFSSAGTQAHKQDAPLADRMRPRFLNEVIGQDHIVGEGRLLQRSIAADRLSSVIFYGPPGTGKTSLARVIANTTKAGFEGLNAVLSGIKDIREAIDRALERQNLYGQKTILFVDEVHRWNKAQQDALLPWVENGTVILVGATTENPFFEVNRALVSRSRIFQLKCLSNDDLLKAANNAVNDKERGYGKWNIKFVEGALDHLVEVSSGDARCLLNALELAVETTPPLWPPPQDETITITLQAAEESIQKRAVLYDKDGDYHFDTISAFIKSVRGSDPDASLYWLAKMVRSGEDPSFIFRRMIILASEDIGLADPYALQVVLSCADSFNRIGFPEGNYPLSHACLYLATAPKSNSLMAFFDALKEVDKADAEVPNHLKDASRDSEGFGHGEGYKYPHSYREHWKAQQYLPTSLLGKMFYVPGSIGYEKKIYNDVMQKRELQASFLLQESKNGSLDGDEELLSWTPKNKSGEKQLSQWIERLESNRGTLLLHAKNKLFEAANIKRSDRVLVLNADNGLLLWEAMRKTPEGLCAAYVTSDDAKQNLLNFSKTLAMDDLDIAKIEVAQFDDFANKENLQKYFGCTVFDRIIANEPHIFVKQNENGSTLQGNVNSEKVFFLKFANNAKSILAEGGSLVFIVRQPSYGTKLCEIVKSECEPKLFEQFNTACNLFKDKNEKDNLYDCETIKNIFTDTGFDVDVSTISQMEQRLLTEREILLWFDSGKSKWGAFIYKAIGSDDFEKIKHSMLIRCKKGAVVFRRNSLLVKAKM